ncbi:MAG: helix-turn-helix transcriptional regulator [Actinomycetales bacterium]|nr:helix-turn-helix transcriptional regulator [Actinomycetales bacterium]
MFGIDRTSNTGENGNVDAQGALLDAFAQLGIDARLLASAPDSGSALVLDLGGVRTPVQVKRRSLVTDEVAGRLLAEAAGGSGVLVVVGDRVTETARRLLVSGRVGYYDLRGRLALRTDRVVIDAAVEPVRERAARTSALSGKAGLEVATALLMDPEREWRVRELARELGRSVSTVSEILAVLRRDGLVDAGNAIADTGLFWQVADRWRASPTYLARLPSPGDASRMTPLRLGLDAVEHEAGWALADSVAAAAFGAPVAVRSGQLLDFYVPDQVVARRATTLLGTAGSISDARGAVRVAPVPAVCRRRVDLDTNPTEWPLAHPLFVALDLARDVGRGRDILDAWTPEGRWARVW